MQLQEEQRKDSVTKNLIEWMKHEPLERNNTVKECPALRHYWLWFQQLSMRDGVVYYKWKTFDNEKELCIVPESLKKEVLERRKLKNIEADLLNIPEVETHLQEILEDEVSNLDEVDDYDAFTDDKSDSSMKANSGRADQTISSFDQTIQSFNSSVNITENTIKDSTIREAESELKEVISLDSGTQSPVSGGILNDVNIIKKTVTQ
ncbi:unnamed protein product [Mytilus coruscus]|uniref:Uncharacterized protein n=1 Tax=Mytilus coruscus TaxID=42192 RepID=A0A6J8ACA4_MYTCO|nr:unnamed protein product [Mytilus coruscus]